MTLTSLQKIITNILIIIKKTQVFLMRQLFKFNINLYQKYNSIL